jgi:hypothetical protein
MLHYATALRSGDPAKRRAAVKELSQLVSDVPSSALASLAVLLDDEDEAVRDGTAALLTNAAQRGGAALETVLEVIEQMLGGGSSVARMKAANLLCRIGPGARPLIPTLIAALRDKNLIFCRMVAQALTHIGVAAIPALEPLRDDADAYVRREVRWALDRLAGVTIHSSHADTIHIHRPDEGERATVRVEVSPQRPPMAHQLARTQVVSLDPTPHSDRRQDARHRTCRGTLCCFPEGLDNAMWWKGEIRDVSRTGFGLVVSQPATPTSTMAVDLHEAHAGLTRKALARVVHCREINGGWFIGCTLLRPLSAEELRLLKEN